MSLILIYGMIYDALVLHKTGCVEKYCRLPASSTRPPSEHLTVMQIHGWIEGAWDSYILVVYARELGCRN